MLNIKSMWVPTTFAWGSIYWENMFLVLFELVGTEKIFFFSLKMNSNNYCYIFQVVESEKKYQTLWFVPELMNKAITKASC